MDGTATEQLSMTAAELAFLPASAEDFDAAAALMRAELASMLPLATPQA